jgi:hypothetical protein
VTSREENNALQNLTDLLASDLSKADEETLLAGIRDAEMTYDKAQEWSGRLIAELKSRDTMSWPAIARATEVPHPTLIRRAKPFLPETPSSTTSDETA